MDAHDEPRATRVGVGQAFVVPAKPEATLARAMVEAAADEVSGSSRSAASSSSDRVAPALARLTQP